MHDQTTNKLSGRRSTMIYIAIAGVVLAAGIGIIVSRMYGSPYTILVEGKPIATVESRMMAKQVLDEARHLGEYGSAGGSIRFVKSVTLRPASKGTAVSDVPEAVRSLEKATPTEAESYAITVDGTPIVALKTRQDAEETLNLVKTHYEDSLDKLSGESTFKERVFIDKAFVPASILRATAQDAAQLLTAPVESAAVYILKPGDRASRLAAQYGISIDDLKRLNPGKNLDRLVEGESLVIGKAKLPITVVSHALVSKTVSVSPLARSHRRSSSAKDGKRQVQLLATYENGQQTSTEVLSQITNWDRPKQRWSESEDDSYSYGDGNRRGHWRSRRHSYHRRRHSSEPSKAADTTPKQTEPATDM